jgi:peptidoglycan/LPS O-acetylase OafA/YrhL
MHKGYIKSLDGVRAIAVLLVMAFHLELLRFGWLGVQLFFVLSGYLIIGILWKEKFNSETLSYKFKKFWVRRSLRIFPLYFGFLALMGICYFLFRLPESFTTYLPWLLTYTFNFGLHLPDSQGPFFTFLWSLSIEEQIYLVFPLIIFFCKPKFIKYFMLAVIFLSPLIRFGLGEYFKSKGYDEGLVSNLVYWNTTSHMDAFFLGGIIPVMSLDKKIKKPQRILAISLLIALAAGLWNFFNNGLSQYYINDLGYHYSLSNNYEHVWHYTLLNLVFASFILTMVHADRVAQPSRMRRFLESKSMVNIGKVSYGMYMFHWGILLYGIHKILPTGPMYMKIILFIPYVIVTYYVALLSYNLFESYFMKLKDKLFKEKKKKEVQPIPAAPASDLIIS